MPGGAQLLGVLVAQLVEREAAAVGDSPVRRARRRPGGAANEARPSRAGASGAARRWESRGAPSSGHGRAVADRGEHVVQRPARGSW